MRRHKPPVPIQCALCPAVFHKSSRYGKASLYCATCKDKRSMYRISAWSAKQKGRVNEGGEVQCVDCPSRFRRAGVQGPPPQRCPECSRQRDRDNRNARRARISWSEAQNDRTPPLDLTRVGIHCRMCAGMGHRRPEQGCSCGGQYTPDVISRQA